MLQMKGQRPPNALYTEQTVGLLCALTAIRQRRPLVGRKVSVRLWTSESWLYNTLLRRGCLVWNIPENSQPPSNQKWMSALTSGTRWPPLSSLPLTHTRQQYLLLVKWHFVFYQILRFLCVSMFYVNLKNNHFLRACCRSEACFNHSATFSNFAKYISTLCACGIY